MYISDDPAHGTSLGGLHLGGYTSQYFHRQPEVAFICIKKLVVVFMTMGLSVTLPESYCNNCF